MIVEQRTYTLRPGTLPGWVEKYEAEGLPIQKKHLGEFLGLYTAETGNLHQVVFMWAYESLDDRERGRAAMNADPDWQKYIAEIWALDAIVSQEIRFLRPRIPGGK